MKFLSPRIGWPRGQVGEKRYSLLGLVLFDTLFLCVLWITSMSIPSYCYYLHDLRLLLRLANCFRVRRRAIVYIVVIRIQCG